MGRQLFEHSDGLGFVCVVGGLAFFRMSLASPHPSAPFFSSTSRTLRTDDMSLRPLMPGGPLGGN